LLVTGERPSAGSHSRLRLQMAEPISVQGMTFPPPEFTEVVHS
jgi:hypothetical protein